MAVRSPRRDRDCGGGVVIFTDRDRRSLARVSIALCVLWGVADLAAGQTYDPWYGTPYVWVPEQAVTGADPTVTWRPCCQGPQLPTPRLRGYNNLVTRHEAPPLPVTSPPGPSWCIEIAQDVNVPCGTENQAWQWVWTIGVPGAPGPLLGYVFPCGSPFRPSFVSAPLAVSWAASAQHLLFPQTPQWKYKRPTICWQIPLALKGYDIVVQCQGRLWQGVTSFAEIGSINTWAMRVTVP